MKKIDLQKLEYWQTCELVHPFTCRSGNRTDSKHLDGEGRLSATPSGWLCQYCGYTQDYGNFEEVLSKAEFDLSHPNHRFAAMFRFFEGI